MVKKIVSVFLLVLLIFPIWVFYTSREGTGTLANETQAKAYFMLSDSENGPCTKEDGSKFTVGYLDIDPYPATGEMIYYFVDELREEGWITYDGDFPFDPADTDAKAFINFLAEQDLGDYIQFSKDVNYYVSDEYDGEDFVKEDLARRIANHEVDIIFCLGTWPADVMINQMGITEVPIMVSGTVDPVGSGLADNEEYSGKENIWCHTNTGVYTNQMNFYYDTHPFTNIGMVYYNETIASLNPYMESAAEKGFKITTRQIDGKVTPTYYEDLAAIYTELVEKEGIDAFLLNSDIIKDDSKIPELLEIFYSKNIPVFVQNSEYYVADGATMVVTASDAQTQAPFLVDAFSKILHGGKPGDINQKFVTPPYLSINIAVTDRLGFPISSDMLLSAEKLYSRVNVETEE